MLCALDVRFMPARSNLTESWEITLRSNINSFGEGWGLREDKGRMRIFHRRNGKQTFAPLGLRWHKDNQTKAYKRAEEIKDLVKQGTPIKDAAKRIINGNIETEEDWKGALIRFKDQKINHGTSIKIETWNAKYEPVLNAALKLLLANNAPTNPADLIDACLKKWKPGSRSREIGAQNLTQFLKHCVMRESFPVNWTPPIELKSHIGRKAANAKSQKMHPISEIEILSIINSIPNDPPGKRWKDAICLMAVYGLRPVELLHLHVRTDEKTNEPYLFCSYEKRSGSGVTRPRRLLPLPIDGQDWNLLLRLKTNDIKLPPLESKNGSGEAARKYLERRPAWVSLSKALKRRKENLGTYSFRHSYSVRGHQLNIDSGSMADMMGHSEQTHGASYPFATEKTTIAAHEKALKVASAMKP